MLALRASRSQAAWQRTIDHLTKVAATGGNLMPPIIAAVEAKATVGEISDTLRAQFGEYRESVLS